MVCFGKSVGFVGASGWTYSCVWCFVLWVATASVVRVEDFSICWMVLGGGL